MPKAGNSSQGVSLRITVSAQSAQLLLQIASIGIYGRNQSEVAARFVDRALEQFIEAPKLNIRGQGNG
jgi:hypothetical protein